LLAGPIDRLVQRDMSQIRAADIDSNLGRLNAQDELAGDQQDTNNGDLNDGSTLRNLDGLHTIPLHEWRRLRNFLCDDVTGSGGLGGGGSGVALRLQV